MTGCWTVQAYDTCRATSYVTGTVQVGKSGTQIKAGSQRQRAARLSDKSSLHT